VALGESRAVAVRLHVYRVGDFDVPCERNVGVFGCNFWYVGRCTVCRCQV